MLKTFTFLAPSLHPGTIADVSIPEPGPSAPPPIVRDLAIKHGEHQAVGSIKLIAERADGKIVIADDQRNVSILSLEGDKPPTVLNQFSGSSKTGCMWAGMVGVQAGTIAALTSGKIMLVDSDQVAHHTKVLAPTTCLASSGVDATQVAMAGRDVEMCIYDVERLFADGRKAASGGQLPKRGLLKETNWMEDGEVWRGKNLPHTSLNLKVPVHHRCLTYDLTSPTVLYSGTKTGSVRHFDTRQRKPVHDWQLAREGAIASLAPSTMSPHELFFADRSSLLGALDVRTGKMLYAISSPVSTHSIACFPPIPQLGGEPGSARKLGMAAVSSDASLRVFATTPAPEETGKGNWGTGKKGVLAGMAGGVGVGGMLWRGYGEVEEVRPERPEGVEEEEEEEDDEEVWEGMDAVGGDDVGDDEGDWDSDSDDEERPAKRAKAAQGKGGKVGKAVKGAGKGKGRR